MLAFLSRTWYNISVINTQRYRSGHNGADSKSVCWKQHEGSNPSLCVNRSVAFVAADFFVFTGFRQGGYIIIERKNSFGVYTFHSVYRRFMGNGDSSPQAERCFSCSRFTPICLGILKKKKKKTRVFLQNIAQIIVNHVKKYHPHMRT